MFMAARVDRFRTRPAAQEGKVPLTRPTGHYHGCDVGDFGRYCQVDGKVANIMIMRHEESLRVRPAVGRRAGFVQRLSISARGHQLRGLAIFPFPAELAHGRGNAGRTGIEITYEAVRCWATRFGLLFYRSNLIHPPTSFSSLRRFPLQESLRVRYQNCSFGGEAERLRLRGPCCGADSLRERRRPT